MRIISNKREYFFLIMVGVGAVEEEAADAELLIITGMSSFLFKFFVSHPQWIHTTALSSISLPQLEQYKIQSSFH